MAKKSLEIHLPYTYKKRFNDIVKKNAPGSNYPKIRTSVNQELTIGNVLDYLERIVAEKNDLKGQVKILKKEKRKIQDDKSEKLDRSNPRSMKTGNYSERADSDISATDVNRKTFDNSTHKKPKLKERTSLMLEGSSKISSTLSYKKLLNNERVQPKLFKNKESTISNKT